MKENKHSNFLRFITSVFCIFLAFIISEVFYENNILKASMIGLMSSFGILIQVGLKEKLFHPCYTLFLFWILCGFLNPLLTYLLDTNYSLSIRTSESLLKSSLIIGTGIQIFTYGFLSVKRKVTPASAPTFYSSNLPFLLEISVLVSWIFSIIYLLKTLGLSGLLDYRSLQTAVSLEGSFKYPLYANYLLLFPAVFRLIKNNSTKVDTAVGMTFIFLASLQSLVTGGRLFVIPLLISLIMTFSIRKSIYFRSKRLLTLTLILLILISAIGLKIIRQNSDEVVVSKTQNSTAYNIVDTFAGGDTAMLSNFALYLTREKEIAKPIPFLNYLKILVQPIPRNIWKDKPRSVDQEINSLLVGRFNGYGVSFTFFGESYYSAGIFGIILIPLLIGKLFGLFYRNFKYPKNKSQQAISLVLVAQALVLYRGSVTADAARFGMACLPYLLSIKPKVFSKKLEQNEHH